MGCGASRRLDEVDDSLHVMLSHERKVALRKGENVDSQGYVPRSPHPIMEKHVQFIGAPDAATVTTGTTGTTNDKSTVVTTIDPLTTCSITVDTETKPEEEEERISSNSSESAEAANDNHHPNANDDLDELSDHHQRGPTIQTQEPEDENDPFSTRRPLPMMIEIEEPDD